MTDFTEVLDDPKYKKVLDKGFVGLIDHMGCDHDIANSARVSYGAGTKSVRQDTGLIRYLVKHDHTSPIEMGEVKLHVKMPMFVARQWVRHRTASINEVSARYSEMKDDFYIPALENIQPQSLVNNQGRNGQFDDYTARNYQSMIEDVCSYAYSRYQTMITEKDENTPGLARELARMVLPVNLYTEFYWKQDLKNMLHLIKLRSDPHAQWEIQQYANAIYELIKPIFPETIRAFDDFKRGATTVTKSEKELVKEILIHGSGECFKNKAENYISEMYENNLDNLLKDYNISKREFNELIHNWS